MPFMIATDLDDTLVGPSAGDREALVKLNQRLAASEVTLVYATGRSLLSAMALIEQAQLLTPAVLISSVGTEIYRTLDPPEPDRKWWEILSPGWDLEHIDKIAARFPALVRQSEQEQGPFKRSFFLKPEAALLMTELKEALYEAGLAVRLIYSSDRDLDILPARGAKGLAVQYLQAQLGFTNKNTVVCGDSGNDQNLFETGNMGIAVGNARQELISWIETQSGLNIYRAGATRAAGIEEGLRYWKLI